MKCLAKATEVLAKQRHYLVVFNEAAQGPWKEIIVSGSACLERLNLQLRIFTERAARLEQKSYSERIGSRFLICRAIETKVSRLVLEEVKALSIPVANTPIVRLVNSNA